MNLSQKSNLTLKKTKARPKCDLCFKSFSRQSSLKTHITTVHKKIKNYECPYSNCNKRFSTNSNMRRHVRIHEKNNKLHIKKAQLMESAIGELEAIRKHENNNFNQENNKHSKDQQY